MYYQNVRGLRTKLVELRCTVSSLAVIYDVIVFHETWLIDGISDAELGLNNYKIFRLDRCDRTSACRRGGGVLIAVRNNFICSHIDIEPTCVE